MLATTITITTQHPSAWTTPVRPTQIVRIAPTANPFANFPPDNAFNVTRSPAVQDVQQVRTAMPKPFESKNQETPV